MIKKPEEVQDGAAKVMNTTPIAASFYFNPRLYIHRHTYVC